jgi:hypothetical protein
MCSPEARKVHQGDITAWQHPLKKENHVPVLASTTTSTQQISIMNPLLKDEVQPLHVMELCFLGVHLHPSSLKGSTMSKMNFTGSCKSNNWCCKQNQHCWCAQVWLSMSFATSGAHSAP